MRDPTRQSPCGGARLLFLGLSLLAARPLPGLTIPVFARKYRTSCSTCHTAAPKLNVMGEAFRLNGYRFPENDLLLRKEPGVPLGEEPWKELWPRSIWPGEVPGTVPLALRIQTDLGIERQRGMTAVDMRFPHELYALAAATLGEQLAAFVETEWSREEGLEVVQAKVKIRDPIPGLRSRLLNIWLGLQSLYPFTFAERQIDRAGRESFEWQRFRLSDLALTPTGGGAALQPQNGFALESPVAAVELNGLLRGRLFYGLGVSQGAGEAEDDNNRHKDFYWKLRYKLGGLGLDGRYADGDGPPQGTGGQLRDHSLTIEHFGYLGEEPGLAGRADRHRQFGVSARGLAGPWDVGAGVVWGRNADPWGLGTGALRRRSLFAKAEAMAYPWLIFSLKAERFIIEPESGGLPPGYVRGKYRETRILPGVIMLTRQNARLVVEAEFFAERELGLLADSRPGDALRARLDLAF